jgi:hypothetical protein
MSGAVTNAQLVGEWVGAFFPDGTVGARYTYPGAPVWDAVGFWWPTEVGLTAHVLFSLMGVPFDAGTFVLVPAGAPMLPLIESLGDPVHQGAGGFSAIYPNGVFSYVVTLPDAEQILQSAFGVPSGASAQTVIPNVNDS